MRNSLFLSRKLLNAQDLIDWAAHQGFQKVLEPEDMHVTIAYSDKHISWQPLLPPLDDEIRVEGDWRKILPLGDEGAIVLRFEYEPFHDRWQAVLDAGGSWDYPSYRPHVTLSFEPQNLKLANIEPYSGPLIFGQEKFKPVETGWKDNVDEIPLVTENLMVFPNKLSSSVKYYTESILENRRMTLTSLLMKNIDLILEAYNVDEKGKLVVANKKKVMEADEVFHQYFVKSMKNMFSQINENDPIMHDPMSMEMGDPMHGHNGMHQMGGHMGGGHDMGMDDQMLGTDEMLGGHMGHDQIAMGDETGDSDEHMGNMAMDDMHMGNQMESTGDYDWVFGENTDMDIDSLFNLTEEEDDEEDEEDKELKEFMNDGMGNGEGDDFISGPMDAEGGHNDFGGDMGGVDTMDDNDGMDDDGDDGDMVTVHGQLDNGGEFEFSFDKDALDFDNMGGDMDHDGGDDFTGGDAGEDMNDDHDFGGSEGGDHEMSGHGGFGDEEEDEPKPPMAEAAGRKPGKGKRGPKTSKMSVVPANPKTSHAAAFPTAQGQKQR